VLLETIGGKEFGRLIENDNIIEINKTLAENKIIADQIAISKGNKKSKIIPNLPYNINIIIIDKNNLDYFTCGKDTIHKMTLDIMTIQSLPKLISNVNLKSKKM
jgi:hypothetical protein